MCDICCPLLGLTCYSYIPCISLSSTNRSHTSSSPINSVIIAGWWLEVGCSLARRWPLVSWPASVQRSFYILKYTSLLIPLFLGWSAEFRENTLCATIQPEEKWSEARIFQAEENWEGLRFSETNIVWKPCCFYNKKDGKLMKMFWAGIKSSISQLQVLLRPTWAALNFCKSLNTKCTET